MTGQRELRLFLAVAVSLAIVLLFGVSLYRFLRKQRRRVDLDLEGRVVEVLEIESDEAVELLADHSSVDPTVVVDLGSDRLLLLAGQWLRDPAVYGASGYSELDDPPWLNGLEPPFAFPSTQFSLERWPKSGEVLSIEVSGEYLNPSQRTSETQPTDLRPLPSQVVTGSLSDLDRSLELLAKQRSG